MTKGNIDFSMRRRLVLLMVTFLSAFIALGVRVAYIQVARGASLSAQAASNQTRSVTIAPKRGAILDRNGEELAVSVAVNTVTINPTTMLKSINEKKDGPGVESVADEVAKILRIDSGFVRQKIEAGTKYEVLKRKVEPQTSEKVAEYLKSVSIAGLVLEEDTKRFYKNSNLAAHVIGMTSEDNRGLMGIEASMESNIKGTPGMIKGDLDARRAEVPLSDEDRVPVQNGQNVVLAIDTAIQLFATEALEKAIVENDARRGGVVIVTDPRNGDVLALVSKPDFDPNTPYAIPSGYLADDWNGRSPEGTEILNKTVWRNKAIMDTYEPGSTFKPFTVVAGLEEGVIDLNSEFRCEDITGYYDTPIGCWTAGNHGLQNLTQILYNSCNPAIARISQRVGIEKFYEYARIFGFYEKTGIALSGESSGIFHKVPRTVDMLVASFGQRFAITPIEMITAYGALANGGSLMKPRLVTELRDNDGNVTTRFEPEVIRQVMSKDTSDKIRSILEGVVEEGTGRNAYISGYRIAGKTGTSQTTEEDWHIASFCSFAPADNPEVCVLVMLDDPQGENGYMGGAVAAPVARALLEEILTYLEVERVYSEEELEKQAELVVLPDLRGMAYSDAIKALTALGLSHRLASGSSDLSIPVAAQMPQPYVSVTAGSTIALYADKEAEQITTEVPDLYNKTLYETTESLKRAGLNIKVMGAGVAKGQSIAAGTEVEVGTIVEVSFRYTDNIE